MLSRGEGRKQRQAIQREIALAHRRAARAKLAELREAIKDARKQRTFAAREAKARCRDERVALRARQKIERRRALEELRERLKLERQGARAACAHRRQAARDLASSVERARAELLAERSFRADLRRIEHGNRARRREVTKGHAKERRSESDDEVRQNIPPELHRLFEKVRRAIKGSTRETRTEAFLRYAEEHPAPPAG